MTARTMGIAVLCTGQLLMGATGCGQSAAITRTDGTTIKGKIETSNTHSLVLRSADGQIRVPRSDVAEIDHPGGGVTTVGAVLLVVGSIVTPVAAVGVAKAEPCGDDEWMCFDGKHLALGILAWGLAADVVGTGLLTYGLVTRAASERAATAEAASPVQLRLSAARDGAVVGLSVDL